MNEELYHYGVKGMHWGIRRYQNPDGTLIKRSEVRKDNNKAFELGKAATIQGRAAQISMKKVSKIKAKIEKAEKSGVSEKKLYKLYNKGIIEGRTANELIKKHSLLTAAANLHIKELEKKYGKENVIGLKTKSFINPISGKESLMTNEKVNRGRDYISAIASSGASLFISNKVGAPVSMIFYPKTKTMRAYESYWDAKLLEKENYRKQSKK